MRSGQLLPASRSPLKDFIEPFLYPHNLFLFGLVIAALRYKKIGLWFLVIWFYAFGNGWVANQVRDWYGSEISQAEVPTNFNGDFVVLGCGGDETSIPDCAKSRLDQVANAVGARLDPVTIHMTTLYCTPYLNYLKAKVPPQTRFDCFHGGETTYHEFFNLDQSLDHAKSFVFVTSDYHAFRVHKLAQSYGLNGVVVAAPSSTFRPVNCRASCYLTVNLSNFDLFAKLTAEMSSYLVYSSTARWTRWYKEPPQPTR